MIEHVTIDYDGGPVIIEGGAMYVAFPPRAVWSDELDRYVDREDDEEYGVEEIYWDSDVCRWRAVVYKREPSMGKLYGMGWYDCN